ncbi:DUF6694 family lipoprotein [Pseudoalteromonas arabiensis]|uniref:DUF6694 family lipoprotein n=1 Tax=Pseudoalteromonas arabiensis TaxID=874454 RepID=UPI00078532C3|nr:DUF6694 family lipoprotein [Pseudoalteromonas arabiensis]
MQLKIIAIILIALTSSYLYLTYEPEPTIDTSSMNSFASSELDVYLSLSEDEKPLFQRAIRFYSYGGVYNSYDELVENVLAKGLSMRDVHFYKNAQKINGMTGSEVLRAYQRDLESLAKLHR